MAFQIYQVWPKSTRRWDPKILPSKDTILHHQQCTSWYYLTSRLKVTFRGHNKPFDDADVGAIVGFDGVAMVMVMF